MSAVLPVRVFCLVLGLQLAAHRVTTIAAAEAKSAKTEALTRKPVPRRDPAGQAFRIAPMAQAARSIAIPLSADLHLAFDTQLLRTHTAWRGEGLNLFGPPYHGGKSPFISTIEGTALWTIPPLCPWSIGSIPDQALNDPPAGSRFRGISTVDGSVVLSYDLAVGGGTVVSVQETAQAIQSDGLEAVVRRFEIAPCDRDLWFLAHAEMGKIEPHGESAWAIHRTNDALVSVVRLGASARWKAVQKEVDYEVDTIAEKNGETETERARRFGSQARLYLSVPAHRESVTFEILTARCEDGQGSALAAAKLQSVAGNLADAKVSVVSGRPASGTSRFKSDPLAPRRLSGDTFYRVEHFPLPKEIQLQVTGMDWLANGDLAVCTWLGEIYVVENPRGAVEGATYRRFAAGLNEPLGLKTVGKQIYVVQKGELTRISDTDDNGEADLFERINADWGYSGNYHAFAFGPVIDARRNIYAFICGQRGKWEIPYVGWCVRIDAEGGKLEGVCSGLRAPNGYGLYGPDNDLFIADNQGNWVGTSKLNHLQPGRFYGYPSGTPAPKENYARPTHFSPPAIWFPRKLSPSTSGFVTIEDDRFGPFKGQMLIGDFQNAVVLRVFLEKVGGEWQGAVWPFAKGFLSGVNRLAMGADGKLYVGGLKNSAWPAAGVKDYSLDRVSFTGQTPFEVREVCARANGFELAFTRPVDRNAAQDPENYSVAQHTYKYHSTYGSPEIDHDGKENSASEIKVAKAAVSTDGMKVHLTLEGWRAGYVTMVQMFGINDAEGQPLWHDTFHYTLNQIPRE